MKTFVLTAYLVTCFGALGAQPTKVDLSKPITKVELIDAALKDLKDMEALLDRAESAAATAKTELAQSYTELNNARVTIKDLQQKIIKSTDFIEKLRSSLNDEIAEAESWRTQYKEVLSKLWFWRKIALSVTGGFALYIAVLILKAAGKLNIP